MNSKTVAIAASIFWLISLALPGISLYSGSYHGFMILLLGWMSGNFAWFANIFLGYTYFRIVISAKSAPVFSVLMATALSLDTFRMTKALIDEGGGTSPVFGYGVGAVFWFMSISLFWVATAFRVREIDEASTTPSLAQRIFQGSGIGLLLTVTVGSLVFGLADRHGANLTERKRLESAAFKRGQVCKTENYRALPIPQPLNGPISISGEAAEWKYYFWDSPLDFLKWGATTVRVDDIDYKYKDGVLGRTLVAFPAEEKESASLSIAALPYSNIDVQLAFQGSVIPALNYHWILDAKNNIACPDLDIRNRPRKLLLDSLGLVEPKEVQPAKPATEKPPTIYRQIPDIVKGGADSIFNMTTSCPTGIEILNEFQNSHPEAKPLGAALKFNGEIHFFPEIKYGDVKAICSGDLLYLTHKAQIGVDRGVQITKIGLPSLKPIWRIFSLLPNAFNNEKAIAIRETEDQLELALTLSDRSDVSRQHVYAVLHIDKSILKFDPSDLDALVRRQLD